jgi:hypothetical protein
MTDAGGDAGGYAEERESVLMSERLVRDALLLLPPFGKCLEMTGAYRPYGPVRCLSYADVC